MADADLRALVPPEAASAFLGGDEKWALTLLCRTRDRQQHGSVEWAVLERLAGLVLIHLQREVEGTFALERADAVLGTQKRDVPDLDWLEAAGGGPEER
ncbi:hypothetical protein [Deinococcus hopiensis]|uniref:Uncharacterized protein n=1 Tax=Deinococcus hopiensis KR-140 TaxID=695939 RepID=A0A1W1V5K1_9DEIO|nr:hypothetical protein [Deinococcus hopiensis]SMB88565.1 hypothetical protein SAMN00790413_00104 [Deinococcus hopiensis KR-140]